MADRPILFSAPMVRALLDGRKTQTRRVLKPSRAQITEWQPNLSCCPSAHISRNMVQFEHPLGGPYTCVSLPYAVGDRLWVRETCRAEELPSGADGVRYLADDHWQVIENSFEASEAWGALFYYRGRGKGGIGNTVPPIHMPRWASRLTLAVTDVRVERLQDISEADALAEGIDEAAARHFGCTVKAYAGLWNSLGQTDETAWEANPWVVAVSFTVARGNIDGEARP